MLTAYELLKLSIHFEKLAQYTALDRKLGPKKPEPRYDYWNRTPEQLSFQRPDPKRHWETINKEFPVPRTPEEIEESKKKNHPEVEEEEELDTTPYFNLPEIEPYHIQPRNVSPEEDYRYTTYQKPGDLGRPVDEIRSELLAKYNQLKKSLAVFYEKYQEANQRAEETVDLDINNLSLIETLQHVTEYIIDRIRSAAGRLFGVGSHTTLIKFMNKDFNLFNVTDNNYRWYLEQFEIAEREIKDIISSYEKLKRLEAAVIQNVQPQVKEFLSHQDNIDLLNWTDQHNPEAKKQVVDDIKNNLYKKNHGRRSSWDKERSDFSLNDLPSLKTFKEVYQKLSRTLTTRVKEKVVGKGKEHVRAVVAQQAAPIIDFYFNQFDWFENYSMSNGGIYNKKELPVNPATPEITDQLYAKMKETCKAAIGLDIGSIEQYLKIISPKRERVVEGVKTNYNPEEVVSIFKKSLLEDFTTFFGREYTKKHYISTIVDAVFKKLGKEPDDLIGKDIANIASNDMINELVKKEMREDLIERIPGIKYHRNSSGFYGQNNSTMPGLSDIKNTLENYGGINFKSVLDSLKADLPDLPENLLTQFIKYMFREDNIGFINLIRENKKGFDLLIKLLAKFGKLEINNLVKRITLTYSINDRLKQMEKDLPEAVFPPAVIEDIVLKSIRNLDTITTDLENLETVTRMIHNEGSNLSPEISLALFRNSNISAINKTAIIKKLYKSIVNIANVGGIKGLKTTHGPLIQELTKTKLLSKNFFKNIQFLLDVFTANTPVNPSTANFSDIFRITSEVETDLDAILMADSYKQFFKDYEYKSPELFKLDYKINDRLRFRVLKDKDPRHLRVGIETDCCQRIGGVGETAAIDSFVNPLAGVLILEWLDEENNWILLTQSYFHYVPEDNGYILDNVESNRKNVHKSGVDLAQAYALYANKLKSKLKFKYFLAGKGYSDLDDDQFASNSFDDDNRTFSDKALVNGRRDHYSDYDEEDSADLTKPKFKLNKLDPKSWGQIKATTEEKIAAHLPEIRRAIFRSYLAV